MAEYRDDYATRKDLNRRDRETGGFTGPLIALGVIAFLFASVFLLSGGGPATDETTAGIPPAPAVQPATPPAQ